MEEEKYFMWYDSADNMPTYGPHYYGDEQLIGKKLYHPLSDLLKMRIIDSLKKLLSGAKLGTKIKVHYLHSNGDLMLTRIDDDQIKMLDQLAKHYTDYSKHRKEMKEVEEKMDALNKKLRVPSKYD